MRGLLETSEGGRRADTFFFVISTLMMDGCIRSDYCIVKRLVFIKLRCIGGTQPGNEKERCGNDEEADIIHARWVSKVDQ